MWSSLYIRAESSHDHEHRQWLKNTGVLDHSTLYLLCVIASCILYTINLSHTMQVYEHVSVNLVIQFAQCARIELYHVTFINSGELSLLRESATFRRPFSRRYIGSVHFLAVNATSRNVLY